MRTIGLLGGMSWESSVEYYRLLNRAVRERLGGLHSAECVMWSVDFAAIEELQRSGYWNEAARRLAALAHRLEQAGAECLVLCTNTMHRLADDIQAAIDIPLLHIADATAGRIKAAGIGSVGLLATRYTMEQDFYRGRLAERHGLQVLVPREPDLSLVHDVIYQELCQGRVLDGSRDHYRRVISQLEAAGANGIIYGCTEIDLLVGPHDASVPVFDSTRIHVDAAVEWALAGSERE
jgi:aspartate racemase